MELRFTGYALCNLVVSVSREPMKGTYRYTMRRAILQNVSAPSGHLRGRRGEPVSKVMRAIDRTALANLIGRNNNQRDTHEGSHI